MLFDAEKSKCIEFVIEKLCKSNCVNAAKMFKCNHRMRKLLNVAIIIVN